MLAGRLERVVNRRKSIAIKLISDAKTRKTRALEEVNSRVKGRLLLCYSELHQSNKTPEQYFYKWFLRSKPEILQRLCWHLIIKQRISSSVAVSRLSYLARFRLARKKTSHVTVLKGLSALQRFIELRRLVHKKCAWDRLNPLNHNGKYFVLERVWRTYRGGRLLNLRAAWRRLRSRAGRVKRLFEMLIGKGEAKWREAFRSLRSHQREQQSTESRIRRDLAWQKKDFLVRKLLQQRFKTDAGRALRMLRAHVEAERGSRRLFGLLTRNMNWELRQAYRALRSCSKLKEAEAEKANMQKTNDEERRKKKKSDLVGLLVKTATGIRHMALSKLRVAGVKGGAGKLGLRERLLWQLKNKTLFKTQNAFYILRRLFGNKHPARLARLSIARDRYSGEISGEGKRQFKDFVNNILEKPDLKNIIIERLKEYMQKRNGNGRYDAILEALENEKDIEVVLNLLDTEARDGNQAAAEVRDMLNNQEKFKVKNLGQFMEDENEGGKYNQLLEFMEQHPDLRLTELARIVQQKHRGNGLMGDFVEQIDEASEVQKIVRYMRENNAEQRYSGLIGFAEKRHPNLAQLLTKIDAENATGRLDRLSRHIRDKDKGLKEKLRDQLILANPGHNGQFTFALEAMRGKKSIDLDELYMVVQEEFERRMKARSVTDRLCAKEAWAKFEGLVNERDERQIDRVLDYLVHANKALKGRLNPIVKFFNQKIETKGEEIRLDDLFAFLESKYGIDGDTVEQEKAFSNGLEEKVYNDHRDLFRTFASEDKLARCLRFVENRDSSGCLESVQAQIRRARPNTFSKFAKLFRHFEYEEHPEMGELRNLLNSDLNLVPLKTYIFESNQQNRNQELIRFIGQEGPDLSYLGLVCKVVDLQRKGLARHVLNFIDRSSIKEWISGVISDVRDKAELGADRVAGRLQQMSAREDVGKDRVFRLLRAESKQGQMEAVLDAVDGKRSGPKLINRAMQYLKTYSKNPSARQLAQLINKRVRERIANDTGAQEAPFPELTDLIAVVREHPRLGRDFPPIKRLLNEENKQSRFEMTLNFIKDKNEFGKHAVLLRELDPVLVARKFARQRGRWLKAGDLPDVFMMASVLSEHYVDNPLRYREIYDFFNEESVVTTKRDMESYLEWMNHEGKNNHILAKIRQRNQEGLSHTLDIIKEDVEGEEFSSLNDVLDRADEEGVSSGNMIEFLTKYNRDGQCDALIEHLQQNPDDELSSILKKSHKMNLGGHLENFLTFVRTGGVDPVRAGYSHKDPLFKILTKYKLLGKFPEIFDLLARRPDLRDPSALLEHLRKSNPNGKYDELISQLQHFVSQNLVFPELGEFNREHPLTRLVHKQLRHIMGRLRAFNTAKRRGEKWITILLKKNKDMQKLSTLQRLGKQTLRRRNRFHSRWSKRDRAIRALCGALSTQRRDALRGLKRHSQLQSLRGGLAVQRLREIFGRLKHKVLNESYSRMRGTRTSAQLRRAALRRLLRRRRAKEKARGVRTWSEVVRREKLCFLNAKLSSMCLSLRKNHRFEAKHALDRWSQKRLKLKYKRMAEWMEALRRERKQEMFVHMKIMFMQKKFSRMCKVLGRFLDFVEQRKRENKMYAFDAMSLDNPWTDRVPKLLACSQVRSAQMCFWKLRLVRHEFIRKRRQRGGGYKVDKLKLVILEKIFTKKMSQYFMQIQIGRPNKYL